MRKINKIYFVGIGGIGTSALAGFYLNKGVEVLGSDLVYSEIIEVLEKIGAKIFIKHLAKNLPKDAHLVIYSPAVKPDNSEIKKARKLGIKVQNYPQALGELTKEHFTIAVSGTHGKSTTASMIALLLTEAGLDPTAIIGTKLKEFEGNNFRAGKGKYLVIEADEWQASFLNYWPKIIVLTNIEAEHLDYYKDLGHILRTYREYIGRLPKKGVLVVNGDDKNISKLQIPDAKFQIQKFSLKQKEAKRLREIIKVPGKHNIYNALAALAVARALKIPDKLSFKTLSEYRGAWRRFEIKKGSLGNKKFIIISDYAHHPTEIKATLEAAQEKFSDRRIWCIFQPHQYQRTFYLFDDFVKVFSRALQHLNKLIITDIYDVAGREEGEIKKKINSRKLIKKIDNARAIYLSKGRIKNYLEKNLKKGEVVIIMGAGDIYKLVSEFSTKGV